MRSFSLTFSLAAVLCFPFSAYAGKKEMAELQAQLASQEEQIAGFVTSQESLTRRISSQGEEIRFLTERLDAAETRIGELEEQLGSVAAPVPSFSGPPRKDLTIMGSVDQGVLGQVLDNSRAHILQCSADAYAEAVRMRKDAIKRHAEGATEEDYPMPVKGTVLSVTVHINQDGYVDRGTWVEDETGRRQFIPGVTVSMGGASSALESCVVERVKDQMFPPPTNRKPYSFTYWFK